MNIDEITVGEAKDLAKLFSAGCSETNDHPYEVGRNYFIRTVTMINTGKLVRVTGQELVLKNVCWIADTGRFSEQWEKKGDEAFDEVEPWPVGSEVIINRGAVIEATIINDIPLSKK